MPRIYISKKHSRGSCAPAELKAEAVTNSLRLNLFIFCNMIIIFSSLLDHIKLFLSMGFWGFGVLGFWVRALAS